jgi:hypothetical protein
MARKNKPKKGGRSAAKDAVISCRFPPDKLDALDAYVNRLQGENPGVNWTRSSAGLNLMLKGLVPAEGYRLEVRVGAEDPWSRFDTEFTREKAKGFAEAICVPGMVYRVMRASDNQVFGGGVIPEEGSEGT